MYVACLCIYIYIICIMYVYTMYLCTISFIHVKYLYTTFTAWNSCSFPDSATTESSAPSDWQAAQVV